MLHIGTLNTGHLWPELRPVWLWRVFVRDEPGREARVRATRQFGALAAGAEALGVSPDDCEAEVVPSRARDF
jgi:hypothetical protein